MKFWKRKKVCRWNMCFTENGTRLNRWSRPCYGFVEVGYEEKYCGRCGKLVELDDPTKLVPVTSKDGTWVKHMSAEEPAELYWNEVYGLGSMNDAYKIAELETTIEELRSKYEI